MMSSLFDVTVPTINEHLKNIYESGELDQDSTIRKFRIVQTEGTRQVSRETDHYNLDAVISVGYRVNSIRATQFRRWATQVLKQYAITGYVIDRKRMENGAFLGEDYFERLLEEIREIRLSERRFYQKVTDIYATSVDYDKNAPTTKLFFATVQNKMHYSVHGRTAAEIIYERADAQKDFMGLTTWTGVLPTRNDAEYAKNYLSEDEIDTLNRIVSLYLDFAELQAKSHTPMYMKDWLAKLDDFLKLSGKELLTHNGQISAEVARMKADTEYEKFHQRTMYELSPVELHFIEDFEKKQKLLQNSGK
jgi:hypothetical protein